MKGKIHVLKIAPPYYEDIECGLKTFEIRKNDRGFDIGDYLVLQAYSDYPEKKNPVRHPLLCKVTYITDFQQKDDYVVMGIEVIAGGM